MITVREIAQHNITVTADETGMVFVNGCQASRPVTAQGMTFVWAPAACGLPKHAQIKLDKEHIDAINDHSAEHRAMRAAYAKKARDYDNLQNEGGEGFNPYR